MESALAVYALLYLSWMLLRCGPSDRKLVGDLFQIGLALPASWMCWRAASPGATVPSVRRAWRLMAAGVFSFALANVAQLFYEVVLHELPYPSAVDVLYLLMYPLIFAGLVQFPTSRASNAQRIQLVLDAAVMAIGGAIIVWYVELGPTIVHASSQPALQDVFSLLYPVGDLIVIGALAGVLTRGTLRSTAFALRVFGAGSLVFITADLIYGYITVKLGQTYSGGDWVDAIWFAGVVLWIVAAKLQRRSDPDEARQLLTSTTVRRRPSWVPYLSVGVGLGLLVYELRGASFYPVLSLLVAALVLLCFV